MHPTSSRRCVASGNSLRLLLNLLKCQRTDRVDRALMWGTLQLVKSGGLGMFQLLGVGALRTAGTVPLASAPRDPSFFGRSIAHAATHTWPATGRPRPAARAVRGRTCAGGAATTAGETSDGAGRRSARGSTSTSGGA
ncbi:Hypothetical protein A7982_01904 [Minicystis rosea]|nr:Hypothetical protein A7982_01904 [Minicystis rosea]